MPAAAVIPAPIAYIKFVAVEKLVVGFLQMRTIPLKTCNCVLIDVVLVIADAFSCLNILHLTVWVLFSGVLL